MLKAYKIKWCCITLNIFLPEYLARKQFVNSAVNIVEFEKMQLNKSRKILNDIYLAAWSFGLKTTYYLRTMAATQIEKSTLGTQYGFTQKRVYQDLNSNCLLNDSDCQSCQ